MLKFKRIIVLLVLAALLSSIPVMAKDNGTVEEFISKVNEEMEEFSSWNRISDFNKYTLYGIELNVSGYLYSHKKGKGYFILDVNDELIEFSAGQSPYDNFLENFKVKMKVNNESIVKEYLLYSGPTFYGYSYQEKNEYVSYPDFTMGEQLSYENKVKIIPKISSMSYFPDVYLSNVEDFTWYKGCAPTAAANLVYYWADNGYPYLTWGNNSSQVISKLAELMGTSSSGATSTADISPGIIDYMKYKGYDNFTQSRVYNPTYSNCKTEINYDRPAVISLIDHDDYNNHAVTLAGYNDSVVDELLIIHDTWSTTATKVYITHDSSVRYLHRIYN